MFNVSGSTSTSTGSAPTCSMTWMLEAKVIGVLTTLSPGPIPSAASATCRADVHELSASAASAPMYSLKSDWKRSTCGPVVIHPDLRVFTTSSISSSPIIGGEKLRNSDLISRPSPRPSPRWGEGEALDLRAGGDPPRPEGLHHLIDFLLADHRRRKAQEVRSHITPLSPALPPMGEGEAPRPSPRWGEGEA